MDVLLDTRVLLWLALGDPRAGAILGALTADDASTVSVSTSSYLEIAIKHAVGKLPVGARDIRAHVHETTMLELNITPGHAEMLATLPLHHRDPFDRILIAQAMSEDLTIATVDPQFTRYEGVDLLGVS